MTCQCGDRLSLEILAEREAQLIDVGTANEPGRPTGARHFLVPAGLPRFIDRAGLNEASPADHSILAELPHLPFRGSTASTYGKYTSADRCRFFDMARGSALQCAACLDVLVAKTMIDESVATEGEGMLVDIVSMLVGLIRSNSSNGDI